MKTKEEIEQLAENNANEFDLGWGEMHYGAYYSYIEGYTQCREDMAKELEQLREAIRKNTWYDEDGNAQVNLHGIDNSLLNKQDNG